MTWESIRSMAAVWSAICASFAALIAFLVYRRSRSTDLAKSIAEGDREIKAHADSKVEQMRQANSAGIAEIRSTVSDIDERLTEVQALLVRLETQQDADREQMLRARDLGPMHERVNVVSNRVAGLESLVQSTNQMVQSINSFLREHR